MPQKMITLKEAAKFLKINAEIVQEMIGTNVFKSTKQGRTIKIDKNEIDEWLANLSESEEEQLALRRTVCRFKDYFSPEYVLMEFVADNKYEAIGELSKFAKEIKLVRDHRWLYNVVVAREELVSTAMGQGVAFLHPRHMHPSKIKSPAIIFGKHPEGIDFDAPDNKPVKYFFMLLLHNDKQHLFSLRYLSGLLNNKKFLSALKDAETPEEVHALVTMQSS